MSEQAKMPQLLHSLSFTITCLYKMPIRRPAPAGRLQGRNFESADRYTLYEHFDILYVRDLFKDAELNLVTRLGRLITRRRQLLRYRKLHNEQLKRETLESSNLPVKAVNLPDNETSSRVRKEPAQSDVSSSQLKPSTKATTFRPEEFLKASWGVAALDSRSGNFETASEPETTSSFASTHTGKDSLLIPSRPLGVDGEELEDFQCPYCSVIVRIRSSRSWK
jgi:hypothetical protein